MAHNIHRFEPWQVWPGSFDNPPADGNYPRPPDIDFAITQSTPIASMGSCFAREIKRKLIHRGYTYITEETDHPASVHASAAWERVYNTFCMRQIFEYTFTDWQPRTTVVADTRIRSDPGPLSTLCHLRRPG